MSIHVASKLSQTHGLPLPTLPAKASLLPRFWSDSKLMESFASQMPRKKLQIYLWSFFYSLISDSQGLQPIMTTKIQWACMMHSAQGCSLEMPLLSPALSLQSLSPSMSYHLPDDSDALVFIFHSSFFQPSYCGYITFFP